MSTNIVYKIKKCLVKSGKVIKIPLQVFAWHNITLNSLMLDACTIPFVLIGAIIGISLVKKLPEKEFRYFTTAVTCISVVLLLL